MDYVLKNEKEMNDFLKEINEHLYNKLYDCGISFQISNCSNKYHDNVIIEPYNYVKKHNDKFDGMLINYEDGIFETIENQAGKNQDEQHIFIETKSFKIALNNLLKGNNRKKILKKY